MLLAVLHARTGLVGVGRPDRPIFILIPRVGTGKGLNPLR